MTEEAATPEWDLPRLCETWTADTLQEGRASRGILLATSPDGHGCRARLCARSWPGYGVEPCHFSDKDTEVRPHMHGDRHRT